MTNQPIARIMSGIDQEDRSDCHSPGLACRRVRYRLLTVAQAFYRKPAATNHEPCSNPIKARTHGRYRKEKNCGGALRGKLRMEWLWNTDILKQQSTVCRKKLTGPVLYDSTLIRIHCSVLRNNVIQMTCPLHRTAFISIRME